MTRSSNSYLEEALERMGDMPDSKKAERLKLSAQALWNYKNKVSTMDNFACIMVGRYLGIDPMKIIAACEEERARSQEKQGFWRDFRSTLGSWIAVALAFVILQMVTAEPAQANPLVPVAKAHDIVFIMSNMVHRIRASPLSSTRFVGLVVSTMLTHPPGGCRVRGVAD